MCWQFELVPEATFASHMGAPLRPLPGSRLEMAHLQWNLEEILTFDCCRAELVLDPKASVNMPFVLAAGRTCLLESLKIQ